MTINQLRESLLVRGPTPRPPNWDEAWRLGLVNNLEILVKQLWTIGLREIFIGGSFAEDRDHPNDIDGYFHCEGKWFHEFVNGQLNRRLNALDPYRVWTWDEQPWPKDERGERQIPMWHQYRVALYPLTFPLTPCGIPGPNRGKQSFDQAFRRSRRGWKPRGMIQIVEGIQ